MNIYGSSSLDLSLLEAKTQYQSVPTTNTTNFAGTLTVNGVPISGPSGAYLPRDGSLAMTGDLNMGAQDLINVVNIAGSVTTSAANDLVTNVGASVNNRVAIFSGVTGKIITDSGATLSQYLPLAGGTMSGSINMGAQDISNLDELGFTTGVRIGLATVVGDANAVAVGSAASAGLSSIAIGQNAIANGVQAVTIGPDCTSGANNRSIAIGYLASNAATNSVAIGISAVNADSTGVAIGNLAASAGNSAIAIGNSAINSGPATDAIVMGHNASTAGSSSVCIGGGSSAPGSSVAIGPTNVDTSSGPSSVFGSLNTVGATASGSLVFGRSNVIPAASSGRMIFGTSQNNGTDNSFLVGNASIVNIRPASAVCDLGSTAAPFKILYVNDGLDSGGATALNLGATNATSLAIGRAGITSLVSGTFAATVANGAWYSTTNYSPAFTAATARLTPPSAATSGLLSEFTQTLGVLTYTGTRTRTFRVSYTISFTAGPSTANMIFFNSINGSTTIGTQSQPHVQIHPSNNATQIAVSFEDTVSLALNDTVELGGQCAITTSAPVYNFVSCAVTALPN